MTDIIKAITTEFPHTDIIHLNHAGIGRWPMCTVLAIRDFAEENARRGATHAANWSTRLTELRNMIAELINAEDSNEIALLKNTSEALSTIAYGIDWQKKDNIIVGKQEFPSNRIVWESLHHTKSLEVRIVDLYTTVTPEQALINAADQHTRLIATSSIQYASGYRMNLEFLGTYCRSRNILFCVDAIQSLGASPVDVQSDYIDFLAADAHKWLLAPEGIALLYCKKSHLSKLQLNTYGWHTLENCNDYDALYNEPGILKWKVKPNAERFECGSINHLGVYALHASLGLLREIGMDEVYRRVALNINYLATHIDRSRFTILTPDDEMRRGGIFTLKPLNRSAKTLFDYLSKHNIYCAYRGGGIRLSPHFYNSTEDLDVVLKLLHENSGGF